MPSECRYCRSADTVRHGKRKNARGENQVFMCKACGRFYSESTSFAKMKSKGEIICAALDLYFKNVSLRKVQDHIKQIHGRKVSHVTILKWVRKYSSIFEQFNSRIKVNGSGTLNADEMMVNVDGKWAWMWNVMDRRTRFITSTHLSKAREMGDAVKIFRESKRKLVQKPRTVITDGMMAYPRAVRKAFWRYPNTEHRKLVKFADKVNNNPIERFHGTVRERTKVMRGFDQLDSARLILSGMVSYYNFIRPHMGLNGLTPAEASGLDLGLNGGNRWMQLISMAQDNNFVPALGDMKIAAPACNNPMRNPFVVKAFLGSIELDNPKKSLGITTEFKSQEKAQEFIKFYEQMYPKYEFRIEEK